jgi:integrase
MDSTTYKDRMKQIVKERGKVYRKELAIEFGIAPHNLTRDAYKLITENEIEQGKDGRDVYYVPKITIIEPEIPIQTQEPETRPRETGKLLTSQRVTKAQQMYDYIKQKDCEVSNRELIKKFNIPERKLSLYLKPKTKSGDLKFRKIGRETFYRLGEMPVETVTRFTKMEINVKQIGELDQYKQYLMNNRISGRTIVEYLKNIIKFYESKNNFGTTGIIIFPVASFTIQDFDNYKTHCRQTLHYSEYAMASMVVALKGYFRYLKRSNLILKDILEDEAVPQVNSDEQEPQPVISLDDFWNLIETVKGDKYELTSLTLLLVMADTGARVGELETICREHIDFENGVITILGEKKRRRASKRVPRTLPLSKLTLQYLQKLIFRYRNIEEHVFYWSYEEKIECGTAVFLTPYRRFMKGGQIRELVRELREKAQIDKEITVHSFRRWLIVTLLNGGMREDFVSYRVGQEPKNISKITLDYARMAPEYRQEYNRQYQRAHPLNQPDFIEKFNNLVMS